MLSEPRRRFRRWWVLLVYEVCVDGILSDNIVYCYAWVCDLRQILVDVASDYMITFGHFLYAKVNNYI